MSSEIEKAAVVCPSCDKRLLVPAASLGKQGRCPVCQSVFTLEQLYEAESAPAPNQYDAFAPAGDSWNAPAATSPFANSTDERSTSVPQSSYATLTNAYAPPQVTEAAPAYQAYPTAPQPAKGQFWNSFLGGVSLMVIAVVWFFGAAAFGVYFIYPPIMFIIGLVVAVKGLVSGNIMG